MLDEDLGKIRRRVAELDLRNAGECSETPICLQWVTRCSFGEHERPRNEGQPVVGADAVQVAAAG